MLPLSQMRSRLEAQIIVPARAGRVSVPLYTCEEMYADVSRLCRGVAADWTCLGPDAVEFGGGGRRFQSF